MVGEFGLDVLFDLELAELILPCAGEHDVAGTRVDEEVDSPPLARFGDVVYLCGGDDPSHVAREPLDERGSGLVEAAGIEPASVGTALEALHA